MMHFRVYIFFCFFLFYLFFFFFFFFQAEDGIRDDLVTGVQTCALPISPVRIHDVDLFVTVLTVALEQDLRAVGGPGGRKITEGVVSQAGDAAPVRSEERRVGKEGRFRCWPYQYKKREQYRIGEEMVEEE